jgi:hypothetical protein
LDNGAEGALWTSAFVVEQSFNGDIVVGQILAPESQRWQAARWNKDGNFDRIRALSLAITCARKMDAQRIQPVIEDDEPVIARPRRRRGPFREMNSSIFGPRGDINRLFK